MSNDPMMLPANILIITLGLFLWNLSVIHLFSRWTYEYFVSFEDVPAEYVGRKVIHALGGGVTAVVAALYYEGYYWVIAVSSFIIAGYLIYWRRHGRLHWFQIPENSYEVHFAFAYGFGFLIGIFVGDIWVALTAVLFMSFGDSATGLMRAFHQKRHIKTWDGTVVMFLVSSVIGYRVLGWYGIIVAGIVSLVEKIPGIDDNITIPVASMILTYVGRTNLKI